MKSLGGHLPPCTPPWIKPWVCLVLIVTCKMFSFSSQAICANSEALDRVLRSYMMMLDFYGMKLNQETGQCTCDNIYMCIETLIGHVMCLKWL